MLCIPCAVFIKRTAIHGSNVVTELHSEPETNFCNRNSRAALKRRN